MASQISKVTGIFISITLVFISLSFFVGCFKGREREKQIKEKEEIISSVEEAVNSLKSEKDKLQALWQDYERAIELEGKAKRLRDEIEKMTRENEEEKEQISRLR